MKIIPPITIRSMIAIISLLITLVISICLYMLQSRFNNEIVSSFEEETIELMKSLNSSFYFSISVNDAKGVDALATSIVNNKYIYSIEVRSNSGEVLSSKINSSLKSVKEIQVIPYEIPVVESRKISLSPFEDDYDPEAIGTIIVLLTRYKTNRMLSSVLEDNLVVLISCILVVLSLIAILGRVLTINFARTSNALKEIGKDDFKEVTEMSLIEDFSKLNTGLNEIGSSVSSVLKELRESDAFRRNIISMISHDLRTPVNTISPLIELMLEIMEIENPDSIVKEHLEICLDSAKILKSIMDQLIDFKEVNNSKFVVNTTQFDPERLFDGINNIFKSRVSTSINFSVIAKIHELDNSVPFAIIADENKILRVLTNILENSIKYTKEGSIVVSWMMKSVEGQCYLKVTIKDTGIGIDDSSLPYIFDQYFRANESVPGWGVGLSVVKQFIEILSGEIAVSSELNEGTEVSVSIPVTRVELTNNFGNVNYECSILVVDDNENNCYVMKNVLEKMGVTCTHFTNPIEAFSTVASEPFDIVIVDYSMPELTGVEFAKLMRGKGINIPVICTTAHIESDILSEINSSIDEDNGITHLLMKPNDIRVIQHMIGSILKAKNIINSTIKNLSKP